MTTWVKPAPATNNWVQDPGFEDPGLYIDGGYIDDGYFVGMDKEGPATSTWMKDSPA